MLELPSEVHDRKFLRMPPQDNVVESDDEWNKCGKWILICLRDMSWIDETWIKLQVLLEKGCLIMIKASTAAMRDHPGKDRESILCYTKPGEEEIERAAKEIRKLVHYERSMYYKINKLTESKISQRNGHKRIPQYMHTVEGFLYRDNSEQHWTLVNVSDTESKNPRRSPPIPIDFDIKNLSQTDFDDLPSRSKKVSLIMELDEIHYKKTHESCIFMTCSMADVENSLSEADRLWIAGKTLIREGAIDRIICKKESTVAKFGFFLLEKLEIDILVQLCDKIRNASQVFRFMYINTRDAKHRYSPEKELERDERF